MAELSEQCKELFKSELILSDGLITKAIQQMKVTDKVKIYELRAWAKKDEVVREIVETLTFQLGDKLTDVAIKEFAKKVESGNHWAIEKILFHSVFGRERGFGDSLDINIAGQPSGPPIITYHVIDPDEVRNRQRVSAEADGVSSSQGT